MPKQFKTLMRRSGIHYAPTYATTIAGAVKQSRKMGWINFADDPCWDTKPSIASIYERNGEAWELIATVSAKGISTVDCLDRKSIKQALADIENRQRQIANAADIMQKLNNIGNE